MKRISDTAATVMLSAVIVFLITFSAQARTGAQEGMRLCEEIILPSLLPVMIIGNLIVLSKASNTFEFIFGRLFEVVFRLPRCAAGAVILGLSCGFPTGAVLTAQLYEAGAIDEKTAARIMRFNFSGGCAFIISAIGTVCSSTETGIILYSIVTLSSLIFAGVSALFEERPKTIRNAYRKLSIGDALPLAAQKTVIALALMSAYIVLFSAFQRIINLPDNISPLFEITKGLCSKTLPSLPSCAFFLSFGGICIHFQLLSSIKKINMKYTDFLISRLICSALSFLLAKGYVFLFPESAEVFSNISSPAHQFSNGGVTLSTVMIIGCAVIVFDIEGRKLKSA